MAYQTLVNQPYLTLQLPKAGAEAANYPFATIDPNVGMVEVPDERLKKLTEMIPPKKTVPTTLNSQI